MRSEYIKRTAQYTFLPVLALIILAVSYSRLFDIYELNALDLRFRARPAVAVTDKAVIIEIGEDAIKKLGRFPFDRSYHSILVKALSEFGAKAIVFDIFFSEPGEHDKDMIDAVAKAGNVYMPFTLDIDAAKKSGMVSAAGYLTRCLDGYAAAAKGTGHINIIPDIDGKFRRIPLFVSYEGRRYPYLSFLMGCDYLGLPAADVRMEPGKFIACGNDLRIPLDEDSNMMINFSGRWGRTYGHYSYVDVLQSYSALISGRKPILDPAIFKDKVCFVGLTAAGTVDLHPNPFETLYPGVGIHAEVFNSILKRSFIARASKGLNLAVLLILGILISAVTLKTKPVKGLIALLLAAAAFSALSVYLFNAFGLWIDVVYPVFVMGVLYLLLTLYKYISEWKRRLVLENELGIARKIQESFLPKKLPEAKGLDIDAAMFTARQVGGDLYDFAVLSPDRIGVAIGDVSGKGVPASLFMAMVTGSFRTFAVPDAGPEEVLAKLNSKLIRESSSNLFVTIFYLIFDMRQMFVYYANGGHLPVLHISAAGAVEYLDVRDGAPLGLMEGAYSSGKAKFSDGDLFVFYTDGITEAMNARSEMYGSNRLAAAAGKFMAASPKEIVKAIERDVRAFEPKSKQHDDMTLIAVKTVLR